MGGAQPPLTTEEAYGCIQNYLLSWEILDSAGPIVLEAVRWVYTYRMAYRDAQIWPWAKMSQIPVVFSEGLSQRVILEGVSFVNPFRSKFNTEAWLPSVMDTHWEIVGTGDFNGDQDLTLRALSSQPALPS